MSLPDLVTKLRFLYHLGMIDINNVLYQLHIRNGDIVDEKAKEHVMVIFNDILIRLYGKAAVDELLKKGKEMNNEKMGNTICNDIRSGLRDR